MSSLGFSSDSPSLSPSATFPDSSRAPSATNSSEPPILPDSPPPSSLNDTSPSDSPPPLDSAPPSQPPTSFDGNTTSPENPPPAPPNRKIRPPAPSKGMSSPPSPSPISFSPPAPPNPKHVPSPPTQHDRLPPSTHASSQAAQESSTIPPGLAAAIAVSVFIAVILTVIAMWCLGRKKNKKKEGFDYVHQSPGSSQISGTTTPYSKSPSAPLMNGASPNHYVPTSDPGMGSSRSCFSYEELSECTDGFSNRNLLGEGGFGCVYRGRLTDGREVAVKQLKVGGAQGEREFQAEVEIISRVHHRHLVSLVGYCISENERLLVYDYVPNDTLHYHIHGRGEGKPVMDWATRVRVAAGAARGLAYLHEDCHPRIIHRDIKSSNILLDNEFEAQVADFGLAKLTADTSTHITTRVMGTFGYLAPEYASSGKLTDRSDVFSFGVVILELITGRRPVDSSQPLGEESLVEWARPLMVTALESGKFEELPDPKLGKNYNEREMFQMIEIASAAVRYNAQMRPRMGRVMRALDNIADSLDINNGVKPGQTQVFNSAEDMKLFQKMAFSSQDYSNDFSKSSWGQREL